MKTVVLAAGYGTRLQPVIGDFPKPLVEVGGRTVLDHLVDRLLTLQPAEDIHIVSNDRYFGHFQTWLEERAERLVLLNDGSQSANDRRGAIGDMHFAIETSGLDDDLLIVAADNVVTFPLDGLVSQFESLASTQVGVRHNPSIEDQKQRGVVKMDDAGRITAFAEKPSVPESSWAAAPLYLLPREVTGIIPAYLSGGGNPDAPGHLMAALVERGIPLHGWIMPAPLWDIGNPASLARARAALES